MKLGIAATGTAGVASTGRVVEVVVGAVVVVAVVVVEVVVVALVVVVVELLRGRHPSLVPGGRLVLDVGMHNGSVVDVEAARQRMVPSLGLLEHTIGAPPFDSPVAPLDVQNEPGVTVAACTGVAPLITTPTATAQLRVTLLRCIERHGTRSTR